MGEQDRAEPAVSVVICTRNRGDKIGTSVTAVLANDHPSFDLTIIDQSTDDATRAALADVIADDERVHYVHTDEAGLSRAYNRGVAESRGPILCFTDDDCVAGTDWISNVVRAFEGEPEGSDLLYGQVVPFEEGDQMLAETPYLMIAAPTRLSKQDGFRVFGMGANFAARRRLFDTVGPFDEILGGGGPLKSSQDYDMTYRTFRAGGAILLRPEVVMRHDGHRPPDAWPALLHNYGFGDGAFYMKHVRCRDPYAAWLAARRFTRATARWARDALKRAHSGEHRYVLGFLAGARASFKFRVDRERRLYVER